MCFMFLSVLTPQNVLHIRIFLSKLNKAFHDKIAVANRHEKRAFPQMDISFQMVVRMRRNTGRTATFHRRKAATAMYSEDICLQTLT